MISKAQIYNFFFHPLHQDHSPVVKGFSIITNIALTTLSLGIYPIIFGIVHLKEHSFKIKHTSSNPTIAKVSSQRKKIDSKTSSFISSVDETRPDHLTEKARDIKDKQADHLTKLKDLAEKGQWQHIQTHTAHPESGFDWWMFPINRSSQGQGSKYQVDQADIVALKSDQEFIANYRQGVILVAKSWGWDLETGEDITNDKQIWTGYQVRLGKMLHSLILFDQKDLQQALIRFIDQKGLRYTFEDWIVKLIESVPLDEKS